MARTKTPKEPAPHPARETVATIRKVLDAAALKVKPFVHEDQCGFVIDFEDSLYEGAVAYIILPENRFIFAIDLAGTGTPDTAHSMAEYIARANYGMVVGNFDMDYSDFSARFRVGLDYEGVELGAPLIKNIVATALEACDTYAAGLADVMQGKLTALEAIRTIEEPES